MTSIQPTFSFAAVKIPLPQKPENLVMTEKGLHFLPIDLWKLVLQNICLNDLHKLCATSKGWNYVITEVINSKLEHYAKVLESYRERIWGHWVLLEQKEKKPVHWENVFHEECDKDAKILNKTLTVFHRTEIHFPTFSAYSQGFLFHHSLCVFHSSTHFGNPIPENYSIDFYDLKTGSRTSLKPQQVIFNMVKISENSFATVGSTAPSFQIDSVKIWEWKSYVNSPQVIETKRRITRFPFFKENMMIVDHLTKEGDLDRMILDFFRLEKPDSPQRMEIHLPSKIQNGDENLNHWIEDVTGSYLVMGSENKAVEPVTVYSVYSLKNSQCLLRTPHIFKGIRKNIAIFANEGTNELAFVDLRAEKRDFVPFLNIKECVGVFITRTKIFVIGDNHLFIYSVGTKQVTSASLTEHLENESTNKIQDCKFIRVTEKTIVFSLDMEFEKKIVAFRLSEMSTSSLPNLWKPQENKGELCLFNEEWVSSLNLGDPLRMNPNHLYSYYFGKEHEDAEESPFVICNTLTFTFPTNGVRPAH